MSADLKRFRALKSVAVGLICAAAFAIGMSIWWLRSSVIEDTVNDTSNLATVLAEQIERSAQSIDFMIDEVESQIRNSNVRNQNEFGDLLSGENTHQFLVALKTHLSQVAVISLVDTSGLLVSSSNMWPLPHTDLSDRASFQHIKNSDDRYLYITDALKGRVTGESTVYFSKRVNGPNDEFIGMISIGVRLSHFQKIYDSIRSLRDLSFVLLHKDGTIILRYPEPTLATSEKLPPDHPWYQTVSQGGGNFRLTSYFDGQVRIISVRLLNNYPLVVNIGMSEVAALANWRRQTLILGLGAVLLICCAALLLKMLSEQIRHLVIAKTSLAQANVTVDAALNNMSQGLMMFDSSARMMVCNVRYLEMYRLSPDEVRPGCTLRELLNLRVAAGTFRPDEVEQNISDLTAAVSEGSIFRRITYLPDGRIICILNHPIEGGGWVATHDDISETKRFEERLSCEAYVDELTELPNRKAFYEELEETLKLVGTDKKFAILYLDVDHLKRVNDTLGHIAGDKLLIGVTERLRECVRDIGWAARLSGDEFAIVQTIFEEPDDAAALAIRIIEAIREPFNLDGRQISVSVSIGIAIAPSDAIERDHLLKAADIALYESKSIGRGTYCFYSSQLQDRVQNHALLEQDLQKALIKGEFELFYQPVASLADNKIVSFEALLRWNHPTLGLVSPAEFIPIAEETGLIVPLGEWVLRTACTEAAKWPDDIQVAVNLSAVQLTNKNLANVVVGAIAAAGIRPSKLELELTESVLIKNTSDNSATLKGLYEFGVQFAVDDFGTGYSSLGYLLSFPFHRIKIDRSFIAGLVDNEDSRAIVRAVSDLAQSLNMRVTAEGVETEQQLKQVRKLCCTEMQGYLLSRPRPAATIWQLLPQRAESEVGSTAVNEQVNQNNQKMCRVRPDLVCSRRLTEHECDVMGGIMAGDSCEESARHLNLSPQLVEGRRASIIKKQGVKSSAEVVQIMLTNGCLPSNPNRTSHLSKSRDIKVAS